MVSTATYFNVLTVLCTSYDMEPARMPEVTAFLEWLAANGKAMVDAEEDVIYVI